MERINLLPPELRRAKRLRFGRRELIIAGLGALVGVLILGYIGISMEINRYQSQIEEKRRILSAKQAQLDDIQAARDRVAKVKESIEVLASRGALIEKLTGMGRRYSEVLRELSNIIPRDVWLRELTSSAASRSLGIKGSALSLLLVGGFIERLEESTYLEGVSLKSTGGSVVDERRVVDFDLTCRLKWK